MRAEFNLQDQEVQGAIGTLYQAAKPSCLARLERQSSRFLYWPLFTASRVRAVSSGNRTTVEVTPADASDCS